MLCVFMIICLFCTFMETAVAEIPKETYILSFKENTPLQKNFNKSQSKVLEQQHKQFKTETTKLFKHELKVIFDYKYALNGMSLSLSKTEFLTLAKRDDVIITPEDIYTIQTDASGAMIVADKLWDGSAIAPLPSSQGEDIVIGILDTGINMLHESFSDTAQDNYDFSQHNPFGADTYVGWCNPNHPNYDMSYVCNNKLIGAWDFADVFGHESDGPEDNDIHGSSMAGIAAGNKITAPMGGFISSLGSFVLDAPFISGIAPHAHVIMYDVCDNVIGCTSSAILAAIEQAILDGVDVLNMSLSGGLEPWKTNSVSLALLNAQNFGIVTSAAAGNATGAQPSTFARVNNIAPWIITSANSFHGRTHSNDVSVQDPMPVPIYLLDMYAKLANGVTMLADLVAKVYYSKDINNTNEDGCQIWNMTDFTNAIALIKSDGCSNAQKVQNAENAGAMGVVIFDANSDIPKVITGISTTIPVLMIGLNDANNIISFLHNNIGTNTIIKILAETHYKIVNALGFTLYHSSLRGPNIAFDVSKPDITAPGTNIFAAISASLPGLSIPPPQYLLGTGTSQATAVTTGALALLKKLQPNWSPSELKSVLMLTARDGISFENNSATNHDDVGSGMLDVATAAQATLTLDETNSNYNNANPNTGGQPKSLNLPSMRNNACLSSCNWTRTLTNKDSINHQWSISTQSDNQSEVIVSPTSFIVAPNEQINLVISFNQLSGNSNEYRFAQVILNDMSGQSPQLRMTIVVYLDHLIFSNGFE